MTEDKTSNAELPGNHGQFGAGDATEAYKPLEQHPTPDPAAEAPAQTNTEDRS